MKKMEFAGLAEKLGLDEDVFMELAELFVETGSSDADKLQSAIEKEDVQGTLMTAHTIKGASGNLGFVEIYELARGVELKAQENSLDGADRAVKSIKEKIHGLAAALNERKEASAG